VSDDLLAKGLSFYDDYDETKLNITDETKKNFTITDTTTKKSVMDEVTLTWDIQKGKWTTTAKDTAAFLKAHGGNKLQIMFHPVVKDDATGVLKNTAVQNDFGQEYQTDTVENNITPDPKPTPDTPNTSYGEQPKGLIYGAIAVIGLITGLAIFWKPAKK
jgi:adhesin isopeptide-forming family sspB-C2 type protein